MKANEPCAGLIARTMPMDSLSIRSKRSPMPLRTILHAPCGTFLIIWSVIGLDVRAPLAPAFAVAEVLPAARPAASRLAG